MVGWTAGTCEARIEVHYLIITILELIPEILRNAWIMAQRV